MFALMAQKTIGNVVIDARLTGLSFKNKLKTFACKEINQFKSSAALCLSVQ